MAENTLSELKKFFSTPGEVMSIKDFKAEWDELSDADKEWFKKQPLS